MKAPVGSVIQPETKVESGKVQARTVAYSIGWPVELSNTRPFTVIAAKENWTQHKSVKKNRIVFFIE